VSLSRFMTAPNKVVSSDDTNPAGFNMTIGMRFRAFALSLPLAPFPAAADGEILNLITEADRLRLEKHDWALNSAMEEAHDGGSADEIATVEAILEKEKLSFDGLDMSGTWQCRTIKVGGLASLVIYDWFRCRVTDDGSGWMLLKETGSQRTRGRFFTDNDTRLTYLGSSFIAGETPQAYGSGPDTDQVGYVYRSGEAEWRIEFPLPARESVLDILELRRNPVPTDNNRR
jgi:hypothetical protein